MECNKFLLTTTLSLISIYSYLRQKSSPIRHFFEFRLFYSLAFFRINPSKKHQTNITFFVNELNSVSFSRALSSRCDADKFYQFNNDPKYSGAVNAQQSPIFKIKYRNNSMRCIKTNLIATYLTHIIIGFEGSYKNTRRGVYKETNKTICTLFDPKYRILNRFMDALLRQSINFQKNTTTLGPGAIAGSRWNHMLQTLAGLTSGLLNDQTVIKASFIWVECKRSHKINEQKVSPDASKLIQVNSFLRFQQVIDRLSPPYTVSSKEEMKTNKNTEKIWDQNNAKQNISGLNWSQHLDVEMKLPVKESHSHHL